MLLYTITVKPPLTATSPQRPGFFVQIVRLSILFTLIETSLQRPPLYNGQLIPPQDGRCREVQQLLYIEHSRQCFIRFPNTSNFVKNTPLRIIFSTLFLVFGNEMKHCLLYLMYYINVASHVNCFSSKIMHSITFQFLPLLSINLTSLTLSSSTVLLASRNSCLKSIYCRE